MLKIRQFWITKNSENIDNIEWSNYKKWLSFYVNKYHYSVEINQSFNLNLLVNFYVTRNVLET